MMKQEQIKAMVTHYGANDRLRLLMEECGELVQASNKILRYPDSHEARVNLIEEMVDVSIMIEQVRTLFNYDDLEWNDMEQYKINRCKKRFLKDTGTEINKGVTCKCEDCEYHKVKGDETCVKYYYEDGKPCVSLVYRCANRDMEE